MQLPRVLWFKASWWDADLRKGLGLKLDLHFSGFAQAEPEQFHQRVLQKHEVKTLTGKTITLDVEASPLWCFEVPSDGYQCGNEDMHCRMKQLIGHLGS